MISFANHQELEGAAAEYALGTLDRRERETIGAARANIQALDKAISDWERRLEPLLVPLMELTPEHTPSPDLFAKIEARLLQPQPTANEPQRDDKTLRPDYWRGLALSALLAFALTLGYALHHRPVAPSERIAVLQRDAGSAPFIISLNEQKAVLQVKAIGDTAPPPNQSFELWLIPTAAPQPLPLGVLSGQPVAQVKLPKLDPAAIRDATLAISVEPPGGSPTGQPTGPVVFTGKFLQASL